MPSHEGCHSLLYLEHMRGTSIGIIAAFTLLGSGCAGGSEAADPTASAGPVTVTVTSVVTETATATDSLTTAPALNWAQPDADGVASFESWYRTVLDVHDRPVPARFDLVDEGERTAAYESFIRLLCLLDVEGADQRDAAASALAEGAEFEGDSANAGAAIVLARNACGAQEELPE